MHKSPKVKSQKYEKKENKERKKKKHQKKKRACIVLDMARMSLCWCANKATLSMSI